MYIGHRTSDMHNMYLYVCSFVAGSAPVALLPSGTNVCKCVSVWDKLDDIHSTMWADDDKKAHTHTHYGLKWEKGRVETSKNIKWSGVTTLCHIATTKMYNVHVVHFILVWLCGFCQSDDCVYGHKETILITTKSTDEINISKIACTLQPHGHTHTHSWSIYAISIAPITKTHQNACWRSTTRERERKTHVKNTIQL